jgi:MurNAc alpha-1-phosphate uridylyltransferase
MSANVPALILAAGRGERMRPLTDHTPKPLLVVQGKRLIEWHLEALARDGVQRVVINTAYLEDQFEPTLGDGSRWGLQIIYSHEGRDHGGALETAGGMAKALPHLGDVFWAQAFAESHDWGRLTLVNNPAHVPQGDFALNEVGRIERKEASTAPTYTYSTIGLYRPDMVAGIEVGQKAALRPYLERAIDAGKLSGCHYKGAWTDVGTPERLQQLNQGA